MLGSSGVPLQVPVQGDGVQVCRDEQGEGEQFCREDQGACREVRADALPVPIQFGPRILRVTSTRLEYDSYLERRAAEDRLFLQEHVSWFGSAVVHTGAQLGDADEASSEQRGRCLSDGAVAGWLSEEVHGMKAMAKRIRQTSKHMSHRHQQAMGSIFEFVHAGLFETREAARKDRARSSTI